MEYNSRINANFSISLEACVAHNSVICFSCKEPRIDDAILFNDMFRSLLLVWTDVTDVAFA